VEECRGLAGKDGWIGRTDGCMGLGGGNELGRCQGIIR
jgi:hypothetical protein